MATDVKHTNFEQASAYYGKLYICQYIHRWKDLGCYLANPNYFNATGDNTEKTDHAKGINYLQQEIKEREDGINMICESQFTP